MESKGPKTEGGGGEARTQGNVLPFPRDWLGPREELVPFGKRADPESERRPEEPELGELPLAAPPADAFWGEGSAEIHAVVPGPEAGGRLGGLPTRRRGADKPIARGVAHGSPAPDGHFRTDAWLRSHAIRLVAGLLVAAACVSVALARLGAAPAGHPNRAGATDGGGPAAGVIASNPASSSIVLALLRSNAQHTVTPAKRTGGGASRRRPHVLVHGRVHAPKPIAHPTAVSVDTAAASSAPAAATASSSTTHYASSGSNAAATASPRSEASPATGTPTTRAQHLQTARSTPATAFGASSALGPGSSPDG